MSEMLHGAPAISAAFTPPHVVALQASTSAEVVGLPFSAASS